MVSSRRWRFLLKLSLVTVMLSIAVAAVYPNMRVPWATYSDFWAHAAAYGILVVIASQLEYPLSEVAGAGMFYSTLLEGLQYLVPGRVVSATDLAANTLGILVGLGIVTLWRRQFSPR